MNRTVVICRRKPFRTPQYRIWISDGKHTETDDGEYFDGPSARDAVEAWASQRYFALQHVDPDRLLVRTPRGEVERWTVSAKIAFTTIFEGVED